MLKIQLLLRLKILSTMLIAVVLLACPFSAAGEETLRVHYQNSQGSYDDLGLWLWGDVAQPFTSWPDDALLFSQQNDFGAFVDVKLADNASEIGFIVLNTRTEEQDAGNKIFMVTQNEIWIRENDDNVYTSADLKITPVMHLARVMAENMLSIRFNNIKELNNDEAFAVIDAQGKKVEITDTDTSKLPDVTLKTSKIDYEKLPLTVKYNQQSIQAHLSWQMIDKLYAYQGNDLGCTFMDENVQFKLWAPKATKVDLLLYAKDDQTRMVKQVSMSRESQGIWYLQLGQNEAGGLIGSHYQYEVTNPGKVAVKVLDPYAKSMAAVTVSPGAVDAGASGDFVGKAAIVDPNAIGETPSPAQIPGYEKREDAIIYEVHVRDFTSDPSIEGDLNARWGTYKAFIDKLDYIKDMGVTHIQLLPVMAWYYGDETAMAERELEYSAKNNNYNWGYDPHGYFSLDGAYSQNPNDPALRIAEFKELVDAIHSRKMGVTLDVVYTHMAKASFLEDIVPDYYFFRDPQGSLLGDFGNNLATNRIMAEKLMVDSVKYWFDQYKIDGMRWDMMGDATKDSVQRAYNAAAAINKQTLFIGEGWRTFKGHIEDPALEGQSADQDWMSETDDVGVFSDEFRNELKSGFGNEGAPMFLTGGPRNIRNLFRNIKAQPSNTPADSPGDMVPYIEAHDNLPLYDIIAQAIKKDPDIPANDAEIHQRIRIGNAMLLTAQGIAFLHAGQEYGRTKQWRAKGKPEQKFHKLTDADGKPFKYPYFVHDSYDSSDAINMFDWKKVTHTSRYPENLKTQRYTRGLIALRRSSDAFRLGSKELVDKNLKLLSKADADTEDLIIAWSATSTSGETFYIFINADTKPRSFKLSIDMTSTIVVADSEVAGIAPVANPSGFKLSKKALKLAPLSLVIFKSAN